MKMRYAAACSVCIALLVATSGCSLVSHRVGVPGIGSVQRIDMNILGSPKPLTFYTYAVDKRLPYVIAGVASMLALATTFLVIRQIRTRTAHQHQLPVTPHAQH